jgi:hypothetical protein
MRKGTISSVIALVLLISSIGQTEGLSSPVQELNKTQLRNVTNKVKQVLIKDWEVVKSEIIEDGSDLVGLKGYFIKIQDSKKSYTDETSPKGGAVPQTISYHPSYTFLFVPVSSPQAMQEAKAALKKHYEDRMFQARKVAIYGMNDQYLLLYLDSDQTNWKGGLKKVADAFGISPDSAGR